MHDTKFFKILVFALATIFVLTGFEEKFLEQNQTGSPKIRKNVKTTVQSSLDDHVTENDEEPISFDAGPASEDRKTFDGWYRNFEETLRSKADLRERITYLHEGLAKIENDRDRLQNLKFNEEIEIDFLIKPLKLLPKVSQFRAESCDDYRMKILSHFEPTAEEESKDPSLKKALNVFKLICTH
ncbi:MAG: hypothetical protein JNL11_04070 [Bdellovibrionaceae bacterium]|nr:hypothetical protein [Pseudobdellovibrionaceae bacterium]